MATLAYLACCLPDYFQGYGGTVLCTSVWPRMSFRQLVEGIVDDFQSTIWGDIPEIDVEKAMYDLVRRGHRKAFIKDITKYLEKGPNGDYGVYLYVGIVEDDDEN
jgi:hypothetical protein